VARRNGKASDFNQRINLLKQTDQTATYIAGGEYVAYDGANMTLRQLDNMNNMNKW